MKKRGLIISVLVLLAVITSGFTYAFWASSVNVTGENGVGSIKIGQGETVVTTAIVNDPSNTTALLVPKAYTTDTVNGVENDSYVLLVFTVEWVLPTNPQSVTGATGVVTIGTPVLSVNGATLDDAQLNAMFNVEVVTLLENRDIVVGSSQTITIKVSFEVEPSSQNIYEKIANATLYVTIPFSVTADAITPNNAA